MQPSPTPPRRRAPRLAWAMALSAATALSALSAPGAAFAASGDGTPATATAKVDSAVLDAVSAGKESRFFVVLKDHADLSAAKKARGHAAKAKAAYDALRTEATASQKSLRGFLDKEKVGYQPYWIVNTVLVTSDDADLVDELAARPDVESIVAEQTHALDDVEPAADTESIATGDTTPEWGVADIKADQVWSQYDERGEGVVIANVDTGVQWDHPALKSAYRGWTGSSASDDYNFYDPTGVCTTSSPCDNAGHGTHTMGTMVGKDGLGVAPGAKWIAAKGCASDTDCEDGDLLSSGQWILAPTDRNGQNPRPDLAPDIVNNSWGGGVTDFYSDIVAAWNAAGIFEAFANGNDGNGVTCSTARTPGAQAAAYAVGAYDATGKIAKFSGFGPSLLDGSAKPDIAAPGVNVRSAWPGSTYNTISGTSMATPHVAGAVALLWAEAPSLAGNIDATRALLNSSARDVDDTHCGGTAGMNNVWGEGKLDILASVDAAPHTAAVITGTATDQATGATLSDMTITAKNADTTRTVTTKSNGSYRLTLPAGSYTFTVSGYGYATGTRTAEFTTGQNADEDFALAAVAHHAVTGTVLDVTGQPIANTTVTVPGTPVPAVKTDASGRYTLSDVAEGSYSLSAIPTAPVVCNGSYSGAVTVDGDETADVKLPNRTDTGRTYSCAPVAASWIKGATNTALTGDEDAMTISLPFPVRYYGVDYTSASVSTNGLVNFLEPRLGDFANTALPAAGQPNGAVAVLWDDLVLDKRSSVQTSTTGTAGSRKFAIVWNNAAFAADTSVRISFEAVFDEATGAITLQYKGIGTSALQRGSSATTGIENQAGTDGLGHSFNETVLSDATAIRFTPKGV
ncbi:S8 family serine peptidase [Streptomyces sp. NPDC051940]|uniref:S8 family serine peptidase n=1 Tax=Streptomyces sp. NPDC051940 TaxID=3155675 RepID=UPI00343F1F33